MLNVSRPDSIGPDPLSAAAGSVTTFLQELGMTAYRLKAWASRNIGRQAGVAVAVSLVAMGARALVDPWMGDRHEFLPAYLAIALAAWLATWRAGAAAACLSISGMLVAFDVPRNDAEVLDQWHSMFALATAAAVSSLIILVAHRGATSRDALQHQVEHLDQADHRKSDFLALVAHELRNPLSTLTLGTELIKKGTLEPGALTGTWSMVERQTDLMKRLVSDLLDVARLEQGKIVLSKKKTAVAGVVQNAVLDVSALANQRGPKIVYGPQEAGDALIDPLRIGQVVGNLLHNAVKFSPPDGVVTVTTTSTATQVCISVKDQGVGIAADELHSIFDSFVQLDAGSAHPSSLGLGLSLSRKLVAMHGGVLQATSDGPGRGAEFTVRLPRGLPLEVPEPIRPMAADTLAGKPGETANDGPLKLLVVDDNRDAAESLALLLTLKGYAATTAGDGRSALEAAVNVRPDMVFLDIGLPDMSGHEVAVKLRQQVVGKQPILVALTGWGGKEDIERSEQAGFDSHLTKPVSLELLDKALEMRTG